MEREYRVVVLDAVRATPGSVHEAAIILLQDSSYRAAAERIRSEIGALPEPRAAVPLLERLAGAATRG